MLNVHFPSADLNEIRPILPQLLDGMKFSYPFMLFSTLVETVAKWNFNCCFLFPLEFFKLMNEVENEDLVFTLETIVDKFGEEMAPYALGLCQNLVVIN